MGLIAGIAGAGLMIGGAAMSAGNKTRVPEFQKVDVTGEQRKAIQGNLANFDAASQLAAKTASADQSVLMDQLRKAIPGYDQIVDKASKNIQSQLSGEINPDVASQVQRSAAARALAGGYGGSAAAGNLTARDLGLTSMGIQQQGFGNALNYIQNQRQTATVQPLSTASMFVSPSQRLNIALQENQSQFQRDLMAAQVAAQPDPMMAAIGGSFSNIGGMMFGGMMGGGGGKGGGGGGSMFGSYRPVYGGIGGFNPVYSGPYSGDGYTSAMSSPDWTIGAELGQNPFG